MKVFIASVLCCLWTVASAEIYKHVLPDGSVEYTNIPPSKDAQPLELPDLTTIPSSRKAGAQSGTAITPAPDGPPGEVNYTSLTISSPAQDSSVRSEGGQVTVNIEIMPALGATDKVLLFLDGKQVGPGGKSGSITLNNVTRGTHTLGARIVNDQGAVRISSPTVTFHLIRRSVLTQPDAGAPSSNIPVAPQAPRAPGLP